MIIETDHKVKSTDGAIEQFEKGQIWEDFSAIVNGRIAAATQNLCNPGMTETLADVRYWQAVRATAMGLGDLPEMLRDEKQQQEAQEVEKKGKEKDA